MVIKGALYCGKSCLQIFSCLGLIDDVLTMDNVPGKDSIDPRSV